MRDPTHTAFLIFSFLPLPALQVDLDLIFDLLLRIYGCRRSSSSSSSSSSFSFSSLSSSSSFSSSSSSTSSLGGDGSVLVFLPGWEDISTLSRMLSGSHEFSDHRTFKIILLHSGISKREQDQVFQPLNPGEHKIILSTNIAETSITIDDVTAVIDSGRHKVRFEKAILSSSCPIYSPFYSSLHTATGKGV